MSGEGTTRDHLQAVAQELIEALDRLSASQVEILSSVARALLIPVATATNPDSDVVDGPFSERMANLLTLHHSIHEEPVSKKPFEYMFKQCLLAQGMDAYLNANPGESSWDVMGGRTRWSLKTEAARRISLNTVKVEKLMEARWVRECTDPAVCATEVANRLPHHMEDYDRIVVLRAFIQPAHVAYSLVEIPKDLLVECFRNARAEMFAKKGEALSFGADFFVSGRKAFRILLDSSVEKIRLWYQRSECIEHASWIVQVARTQEAQQSVSGS